MCDPEQDLIDEIVSICPACGQPIDYCSGHGAIGDPAGAAVLEWHDAGNHSWCDRRAGCRPVTPGVNVPPPKSFN